MFRHLEPEDLTALEASAASVDVPYLPLPNRVDAILSDCLAPDALNPTAFAFAFREDGYLAMANNRRRGPELPGGHREAGEDALAAAIRETLEETGCTVSEMRPIGIFRSVTTADKPDGYRYPHPVSCQQFFAGLVTGVSPYVENDECLSPAFLSPEEVAGVLDARSMALYQEAYRTLFPEPVATP